MKLKMKKKQNNKGNKKLGFGISKSSPRISSIKVISNPYENQKQREALDISKKIKILLSYGDINNYKNNNIIKLKKISKVNIDAKNYREHNNSLNKDRNKFNFPNFGLNLMSTSDAQNMLIEAVGKINSQLIKNHPTLKSANLKNQLDENYQKKRIYYSK